MKVIVLRLGHRAGRDPRISTHCALVARAFGADGMIYSGEHDSDFEDSVNNIVKRWGGPFELRHEKNWRKTITSWKGASVHLTIYGMPVQEKMEGIRKARNLLIIIGGQKVPAEVYHRVDHNISVTGQPHSEVAALAVFMHELFEGKEPKRRYENAKIRVVPQEAGKKTVEKS